ncbi:hypothetical protein Q7C18_02640 [Nesterenkonia sp. CL21]|uniref:hypothetical protein n=1 Tax=Nesterenkonia sp. CL21 TaxID=3064894 RepID=UPI0028782D51|nr:hypothetical protein [Nesterenkonia sp. CL21]MDS2171586.1 hypothetical protein [Nesterenkonia sp. CL21]
MSEGVSTPYELTLKADKGYDAPWLRIQAETVEQLHDRVKAVQEGAVFSTLGNAAKDFQAAYQLGKQLGAEPMSPPQEKKPAPASAKPAETSESPWPSEPGLTDEKPKEEAKPAAAGGRPKPAWKK